MFAVAVMAGAGASTAGATASQFFGVDAVSAPTQAQLVRAARGGAGIFRLQFQWQFVEPSQGAYQWRGPDQLVAAAAMAGTTLLPDLYSVPGWISPNPAAPPIYTSGQRQAWANLLTNFAARYGNGGTFWAQNPSIPERPITTWEIWNEPNLGGFFGGRPNAKQFARLLQVSSQALKAGDPHAQVLTGGIFPYHTLKHTVEMVRFMKALYRVPGVTRYFDALGLHPYGRRPKDVLKVVAAARRVMDNHGDAGKPIWVTEVGWVTGGRRVKYSPLKSTLRQQAHRLTRTYRLLAANASRLSIASVDWFSFTDRNSPGPDYWVDRAGLFRLNGKPKPSWYAFTRVAGGTP
jgi:polysaccharide biosynthesis protein PslG